MAGLTLLEKVQGLTDLELAVVVSLIADEHCIVESEADCLATLETELQLTASGVLGLPCATVQCSQSLSLEDLSNGILIEPPKNNATATISALEASDMVQAHSSKPDRSPNSTKLGKTNRSAKSTSIEDERCLANVIILKDLDLSGSQIQIQVLELMRTRRIFSHVAVHTAPKQFVIIVLQSDSGPRLNKYLNDHLFISHYHNPEDGYPNLEEKSDWVEDDRLSMSSVLHRTPLSDEPSFESSIFQSADFVRLANLRRQVSISAEVGEYLHNVATFLRLHRAAGGGITPRATQAFNLLAKCLATLHGLDYVTPSLVALAAGKVYSHRLEIVSSEKERSMQYGGDLETVAASLQGLSSESVVTEVLQLVEVPL